MEAMGYAEAGIKPPKEPHILDLPIELVEAMESDPRSILVISRDGFILWARASEPAFKQ
jgi:hypothetical protein